MILNQKKFEELSQLMADKGVVHPAFEILADLRYNEKKYYNRLVMLRKYLCEEKIMQGFLYNDNCESNLTVQESLSFITDEWVDNGQFCAENIIELRNVLQKIMVEVSKL